MAASAASCTRPCPASATTSSSEASGCSSSIATTATVSSSAFRAWPVLSGEQPENVKGIRRQRARRTRLRHDHQAHRGLRRRDARRRSGRPRPKAAAIARAISPDGRLLYVRVVRGTQLERARSSHRKDRRPDRSQLAGAQHGCTASTVAPCYLAGLAALLVDRRPRTRPRWSRRCGPFSQSIRPFTVNGKQTLVYVNVNELLGFEIGDIKSGRKLQRVEVQGFQKRATKRRRLSEPRHRLDARRERAVGGGRCQPAGARVRQHGDAAAQRSSIACASSPAGTRHARRPAREACRAGEIIDVKTKAIVATLTDETGAAVHSEKVVEVIWKDGRPVRSGDQFGVGRKR